MTDTPVAAPARRLPYIINGSAEKGDARVSVLINNNWRSLLVNTDQGERLIEMLKQPTQDLDAITELVDVQLWVAKRSQGRVTVDECDRLRLDGKLIDYGLTGRIGAIIEQGMSFEALANFIERLSRNPDETVAEDLYRFMEKGNLPLDPEGYVLAFKKCDDEYNSYFSGAAKVNYAPGSTPSMPREDCDPNRHQTCSRGLHACSYEYLNFWYKRSGRVVIVRIDPEHVTAIPADHNDQKLRCCQMEVLAEIAEEEAEKHFAKVVDARYPPRKSVVEAAIDAMVEARGDDVDDGEAPQAPADAVNDAREDDDSAPVVVEWSREGYKRGYDSGASDFKNGYEFEPSMSGTFPDDLTQEDRPVFCKGFVEGYEVGYRFAQDEAAWSLDRAETEGKTAGVKQAKRDHPHYDNNVYDDCEPREDLIGWIGETFPDVVDVEEHELVVTFDKAARNAYHETFNALDEGGPVEADA